MHFLEVKYHIQEIILRLMHCFRMPVKSLDLVLYMLKAVVNVAIKRGLSRISVRFWLDHNFLICIALFHIFNGQNKQVFLREITLIHIVGCSIRLGE